MTALPALRRGEMADVTLLLEGTYPFVSGGVSSWVHQIVRGTADVRFALVFIGGSKSQYGDPRYPLPPNVVHVECHYLEQPPREQRLLPTPGDAKFYQRSAELHDALRNPGAIPGALQLALNEALWMLIADPERHEGDFLHSARAYDQIAEAYGRGAADRPFLDYFWAVRSMHAPLFQMARIAAGVPPSRAFHVISTGFAGFLGALLTRVQPRPLILTEHGIYTKERRIELLQATWIAEDDTGDGGIGVLRRMWIRFFEALGRMTYAAADPIVALYEGNRARQIRDGAEAARTSVVPNGIDLAKFAPLRDRRQKDAPRVLGLIGRVVPIKDIKTFLRAVRVVRDSMPDVEGWIAGPEDEDRSYAAECHHLAESLGLGDGLKFLGFRKVDEVFPKLTLNVLTSISEAQPLVVLEGFAAGVPSVATDVGCCRELIFGREADDQALGAAGAVVDIADPDATARECMALLRDEGRWQRAQQAGIARVERYYTDRRMLDTYAEIYRKAVTA